MTWLLGVLGISGVAAGALGLVAWFSGGAAVVALLRGVWAWLMKLLRYFGDGLFGIAKRPVEMFACSVLCLAAMVFGIWVGLAWTKHVREQAKGTVANIEAAHEREDDADKALAAAAVQARAAAEAAERKRQATMGPPAPLETASTTPLAGPVDDGVRVPEAKPAARAPRRVRRQEPSVLDCIQAAFGKPVRGC